MSVGGDSCVEQLALGVERPELEVVDRQLALHAERLRLEVGGGGLGVRSVRLNAAADASPDVDVPGEVERQDEVGCDALPWHSRARRVSEARERV